MSTNPMTHHSILTPQGVMLPVKEPPVRFAVGPTKDGLTSNSWRMWTEKRGDVYDLYLKCRDNFREAKVSLHASGRWRMGFTEEAIKDNCKLPRQGDTSKGEFLTSNWAR